MSQFEGGGFPINYYSHEHHCVLSDPLADVFGPNIRIDGRNLTIVVLSLNRASLTIRMLRSVTESIPDFRGKILIADNGSSTGELASLKLFLKNYTIEWRLLEFGSNFGVAGGRNKAVAEVTTDWFMSLDNDIYFIANPIPQIQHDLALFGCHFLSVPLLNPDMETIYAFGGSLQSTIQKGMPRLTISSVLPPHSPVNAVTAVSKSSQGFLCTFLYGGASVLNSHTFRRLGGFDDNMLVGFEDIDFSLRLFREGLKVGSTSSLALVHDHPKAENASAEDYERIRYSRSILKSSAHYLERKTGFVIWGDEVENWLTRNEEKQGAAVDRNEQGGCSRTPVKRPKIALITDTDSWAFANISRQIVTKLSDAFDFETISLVELEEIEYSRWLRTGAAGQFSGGGASAFGQALMMCEDADVIHVFWREFLSLIDSHLIQEYSRSIGMEYSQFRHRYIEGKVISTSVYDHLFLSNIDIEQRKRIFSDYISGYTVSSERLAKTYLQIGDYPAPDAIIEDGVDLSVFRPRNIERFDNIAHRPVIIGWVGNSKWASTIEDFKGVHTILNPALRELQAEGMNITLHFADRQNGFIPHKSMPKYYSEIDVYICTSKIEGTPNPVLEAMACGVPVITTDVGIVPQVFGPLQREFILAERSVECLKNAVRKLLGLPGLFKELSKENLHSIRFWDWRLQAGKFGPYFNCLLEKKQLAQCETRTKLCMLPFTTPSMEPDGSIRLCSASTIHDYYDETNMGNCRNAGGLKEVWSGDKYRRIRASLFTGENLRPYCSACEYRFDGPVWMFQLHLALYAFRAGMRDSEIRCIISRWRHRHEEYQKLAHDSRLEVLPLPDSDEFSNQNPSALGRLIKPYKIKAPWALVSGRYLPVNIDLNTLNRCNVSCVMCPHAVKFDDLGDEKAPYYRLTLDEYNRVTNGVMINSAHFVGAYAEPLLNKDIFALIRQAHSRGAFTAITSNGMALSEEFAVKLVDAGLDMISISLHGATKDVAEAVMRGSDFERIVQNIRTLQRIKGEKGFTKPEIYFNYVGMKMNIQDFPPFIDLSADLDVRFIHLFHLLDGDQVVDKSQNLIYSPALLVEYVQAAKNRARERGVNVFVSPSYEAAIMKFGA